MKKLFLLAVVIIACVCLTACGIGNGGKGGKVQNADVNNVETENNQEPVEDTSKPLTLEEKAAKVWMSLPENVDMYWKVEEKNAPNYSLYEEYKRGNDVMIGSEGWENGARPKSESYWLDNYYFYYKYKGDYKWDSYVHYLDTGWKEHYFHGNYPSSPQTFGMGRQYVIQEDYTDEHETIFVEGLGDVDTVKGTLVDYNGTEYTVYYSKQLGFNIKYENIAQAWYLTKFDTSVGASFPHELPN
ncbi:MAG: hypothetical protein IKR04_04230 [Clostridia bacterium]|nr:hypothetical protein [Clostridia bacterium]